MHITNQSGFRPGISGAGKDTMHPADDCSRRDFIKRSGLTIAGGATAASALTSGPLFAGNPAPVGPEPIWANLVHLGYNMWIDRTITSGWGDNSPETLEHATAKPYLRHDAALWDDILKRMAQAGMNMIVLDLGEAIRYKSHPELGVKGSWSPERLKDELAKMREMGLEPIPKMNFSTGHDIWLGPYARCVSTPTYYKVCSELIAEAMDIFDHPRFFHLGYDEETADNQKHYAYVVVRQHALWWHDFNFFVNEVEKHNARPWIWSDYVWDHPEEFYEHMPRSVLQSNWYYSNTFEPKDELAKTRVQTYRELDTHGYDQIPGASNWSYPENFEKTVAFCRQHIAKERLLGFMQTTWRPVLEVFREKHLNAIELVARVIKQSKE